MPQQIFESDAGSPLAEFLLQLLVTGGIVLLIFGLTMTVGVWLIVRRIRRAGFFQRRIADGRLLVRSFAADGTVRQLARLRRQLRRSTEATERSLAAARAQGHPVGELPAIAANLGQAEHALEARLRLAEQEPDRRLRAALGRELGAQTNTVTSASAQLRESLLQTGDEIHAVQNDQTGAQLRMEIEALHAWTASYGAHRRNRTTPV